MSKHDTKGNSRNKISSDKLYCDICKLALWGKKADFVVDRLAKVNAYTFNKIKPLFDELVESNQVVIKDGILENNMKKVTGKVIVKPGENFIHVKTDKKDVYVYDRGTALDGDEVEIALRQAYGKLEGVILKIIKRAHDNLTGVVEKCGKEYKFYPSNKKFDVPVTLYGKNLEESVHQKVKVKLLYSEGLDFSRGMDVLGTIDKIYGPAGDPIVENVVIAEKYGFVKDFSSEVMDEADKLPDKLLPKDWEGVEDLTDLPFVTIDPKTCKDIDDAIYVTKTEDGNYLAYVALADVQHYVKQGSLLDQEAFVRGTSCYLGDGVYPMLPEKLSNGICSLNPNEARRAIVGGIIVDKCGDIVESEFCQAVVKSVKKLSYEDAQKIHDGEKEISPEIKESIDNAFAVSDILVEMRRNRGAIEINNPEPTFVLDKTLTSVERVVDKTCIPATKVIESLMILFNEGVGKIFDEKYINSLYRTHDEPYRSRIDHIIDVCEDLNIPYDGDSSSKGIQRLLNAIHGNPYEKFMNHLVLTNMKKARYSQTNWGHYALASESYIHSTAAIRRYPDIVTQRNLVAYMQGKKADIDSEWLANAADYLSAREIQADKAELESDDFMRVLWAEKQIYKTFNARIKGVVAEGAYAEIESNDENESKLVSVFIPMKDLVYDNFRNYKANRLHTKLINPKTGKEICVGDKLEIIITGTDRNTRLITGERVRTKDIKLNTVTQEKETEETSFKQVNTPKDKQK